MSGWRHMDTKRLNGSHLWEFRCEEGAKREPMHELSKLGQNHKDVGKFKFVGFRDHTDTVV
jgi:hypothetical protein